MTFEEQLEALAASQGGELTEEQLQQALSGTLPEGDTSLALAADAGKSGAPDAGTVTIEPKAAPADGAQEPTGQDDSKGKPTGTDNAATPPGTEDTTPKVILAKDGVHTISYDKLIEARDAAAAAKAEAATLRAQLAAATAAPPAPAPAGQAADTPAVDPSKEVSFGNYDDKDLAAGVQIIVDRAVSAALAQVDQKLSPVQEQMHTQALKDHFATIYKAHPDAESIVMSTEFEQWKAAQPTFVRDAYENVQTKGNAQQMVELLSAYRVANPVKAAPAPAPAPAPAANNGKSVLDRAEEAIKNAKTRTPNSLSDLPAGTQAHHDEADAVGQLDSIDLMNSFAGKTPKQIEALMVRLL